MTLESKHIGLSQHKEAYVIFRIHSQYDGENDHPVNIDADIEHRFFSYGEALNKMDEFVDPENYMIATIEYNLLGVAKSETIV